MVKKTNGQKFVFLHNHSRYSPLDGLISLKRWIEIAKERNWEYLGLTDTDGVYGMIHFIQLCQENGIRPIVGSFLRSDHYEFTCLSRGKSGLHSLYHLISYHHQHPSREGMMTEIKKHHEHIVIMTDDMRFLECAKTFTHMMFYEYTPGLNSFEEVVKAKRLGFSLVGSYRIRMEKKEDFYYYRLLRAIKENNRFSYYEYPNLKEKHCFLPEVSSIENDFHLYPEAIQRTQDIAKQCEIENYRPKDVFPTYQKLSFNEAADELWRRCIDQIHFRYNSASRNMLKEVQARLEFEFEVIREKEFCSYFLVVADIVSQSRINCGRGSGASSIVCYLLGITHVDPIRHDLFFDRFLNRDRNDPPDIDIDFPWDERDEVFDYVFETYENHVAFVANHNFLRERQAIREVAKTYGVGGEEISHMLDRLHAMNLENLSAKWKMIVHHGLHLVGCLHHLSMHCGGVVITPREIEHYCPVQTLPKGFPVIQWEKDQAEGAGLVKIDLLGNRSLAVIRDTILAVNEQKMINEQQDLLIYEHLDPVDDHVVEKLICSGNTMGVFYIESPGTRLFLQKMKSAKFEHGVIAGSIIRPAANKMANEFVRRLHGGKWKPLHPVVEKVLAESFGLMIYQEHVNLVAMGLSSFSAQEGNELRKVLGKKHKEKKLHYFKQRFFEGAMNKGASKKVIEQIWEMIQSFAGYSFCKAHSASYCLVSFKSCYLKAHFPAEFMASVISNQGGFYSTEAYLDEVRRMGLKVLPACVQKSQYHYVAEGNGIRVGLMQIKRIKKTTLQQIFDARSLELFKTIEDFLLRTKISFIEAKILCRARCLNALAPEKNLIEIMWRLYFFFQQGKSTVGGSQQVKYRSYEKEQIVRWEEETLGGHISYPQWALYEFLNEQSGLSFSIDIPQKVGQEIILFGTYVTMKKTRTKKKESMCFCSFTDPKGIFETVFFPNEYYLYADLLFERKNYLIRGKVMSEMGALSVQVKEIKVIDWQTANSNEQLKLNG